LQRCAQRCALLTFSGLTTLFYNLWQEKAFSAKEWLIADKKKLSILKNFSIIIF
jgi:hypothetical protein